MVAFVDWIDLKLDRSNFSDSQYHLIMEYQAMTIGQQSSAAAQRRIIVGITEPGYADHSIEADILKSLGAEVRILRWAGDRSKLLEMLDRKGLEALL